MSIANILSQVEIEMEIKKLDEKCNFLSERLADLNLVVQNNTEILQKLLLKLNDGFQKS